MTTQQGAQSRPKWTNARRLRRFLYLVSPAGQLAAHPAMAVLWGVAAACVALTLVMLIGRRAGWVPWAVAAAALIFNMIAGSLCQILYEEFINEEDADVFDHSTRNAGGPSDGSDGPGLQPRPSSAPRGGGGGGVAGGGRNDQGRLTRTNSEGKWELEDPTLAMVPGPLLVALARQNATAPLARSNGRPTQTSASLTQTRRSTP